MKTLRFALSKLLPIILRLWGVDTEKPGREGILIDFQNAAARRHYARTRADGSVSRRRPKLPG
ncbi:hypothetical protein [Phyllobacterium lublinensis]|uniref:hypothetical protein n=1 Tax=Phyllobacterium lublinensis TaxID=2875708 RepID=UPI001CC9FD89|nr:hypothetical protein [Phyllobacterium sp. 2063]MBZ9656245.1 hypothetical protein [Phyllobacterium sp. 2063]